MQLEGSISYQSLPFHNKLIKDYLNRNPQLKKFYSYSPDTEGLLKAAGQRQFSAKERGILVEALCLQYGGLADLGAVGLNLDKLRLLNSFTVTTGHQLCAYTGPAYFIYKIASVINLARQLNEADKTKNYIPVFWMASEDHDFEEISQVNFYGKSWKWEKENENFGKIPVGLINPNYLASWAGEMRQYFREELNMTALLEIFEKAYSAADTLAQATRMILHELFGESGLVIIDGNDSRLKEVFKPVLLLELVKDISFKAIKNSTTELLELGYTGQINPRDTNLFYFASGAARERLDRIDNDYMLHPSQKKMIRDELLKEGEVHPEKFSPNVVLRPVYQETILPNIAYIGGPGEIAYWLQLKKVFESFNIPFPVLLLRASFAIIPGALMEKAVMTGIAWPDYFNLKIEEITRKFLTDYDSGGLNFEKEYESIAEIFNLLNERAGLVDDQLIPQLAVEQKNMNDIMAKILTKFNKALKQKSASEIKIMERIKGILFPQNTPQERFISGLENYSMLKNNLHEILKMANPLENELKLLKI